MIITIDNIKVVIFSDAESVNEMNSNMYSKPKKISPEISLVRTIALFLIIQSHCDRLFPASISFLATGGAIGNELFFLVGGFLYSTENNIKSTTLKRFIRLYIPTYIMTIMLYAFKIVDITKLSSIKELVYRLIWPTSFWFIGAMFFAGIFLHLLVNINFDQSSKNLHIYGVIYLFVNILIYIFFIENKNVWIVEDHKFFDGMFYYKCIYSFFVFVLGYEVKTKKILEKIDFEITGLFLGGCISFFIFYGFKYMLNKGLIPMQYQIISQPLTVIFVLFIFTWIMKSKRINLWLSNSCAERLVNQLGGITLEAFLVQFEIISVVAKWNVVFPINYLLCVLLVISSGFLFKKFDSMICNAILDKLLRMNKKKAC